VVTQALVRKAARVVYASSAVLYGDQDQAAHGTGDPVHVTDAYNEMKHASESVILARGGTAARLVNVYGPGMPGTNVLSDILAQLDQQGPVRVMDASSVRDFLWLDDAAAALAAMATAPATGVFNVGTGVGTSIAELARLMLSAAGQPGRPIESTRSSTGRSCIVVDASTTTDVFGWRPGVSLSQGIAALVRHHSGRLQREQA
jgi:UDP-glucose 4-epimerase